MWTFFFLHLVALTVLVGSGVDEYQICEALKSGRIKKPLVAWCIGTCASMFPYEVQFGKSCLFNCCMY